MNQRFNSAFTLIELVLVIVIVGLLAAVVTPKFGSLRGDAEAVSEKAAVSAVRSGIKLAHMRNLARGSNAYPSTLDDAANGAAAESNPLFTGVIDDGIIDGNWAKSGNRQYTYQPSSNQYTYDQVTGWFGTGTPPAHTTPDPGAGGGFDDLPFPDSGSGTGDDAGDDPGDGSDPDDGDSGVGDDPGGSGDNPADNPGDETGEGSDDDNPGGISGGDGESGGLSREDVLALTPEEILAAGLTPEQFSWLTPDQLAGINYQDFASFTPEQIAAMTAEQLAALNYDQFGMVLGQLAVAQMPWARPDQIAMLSPEQFATLSDGYLAALTEAQWAEKAIADNVRTLRYSSFRTVDPNAIKYLTAAQIASIPDSYEFSRWSAEQRAGLWYRQVQALNTNKTGISLLTEDQRQFLTTAQVQSITYSQFRYVPVNRVAELTLAQIAAIPDSYEFSRWSDDQRYALTAEQVQGLNTNKTGISLISETQRAFLTTGQVQSITYSQYRYLPVDRVQELTTTQIAAIPDSYEFSRLSDEQRHALTDAQVQSLNTGKTGISLISEQQRTALTTAQVQAITYSQYRYLPVERVSELTATQVAAIPDSYEFSRLSDEQRYALTDEQVQSLNTGKTGISLISEQQRTALTTTQVQAITYSQYRYLPVDRVTELTASQIAAIPDSYEFGRLSDEQRYALTDVQVQALNTGKTGISLINAEQRSALTTTQVQAISYSQYSYLPVSKVSELTASQIAAIPSSYEFGRWSSEQRAALTAEQVPSLNVASTGISLLPETQRTYLTTAQVQDISYSQHRYLPVDRVSELTAAQIASIPSSYEFSQWSTDQRSALTSNQVQSLNVSNVGIDLLPAAQRNYLSTTQVQTLNYSKFSYLPSAKIPDLTTDQIASIPSTYYFNQISTDAIHTLTQAQVLSISDAYYDSIKYRLTAEQLAWRP